MSEDTGTEALLRAYERKVEQMAAARYALMLRHKDIPDTTRRELALTLQPEPTDFGWVSLAYHEGTLVAVCASHEAAVDVLDHQFTDDEWRAAENWKDSGEGTNAWGRTALIRYFAPGRIQRIEDVVLVYTAEEMPS